MNAGKTSRLIQAAHNYEENNRKVLIFTSALDNRYGTSKIASRIGLERPAIALNPDDNETLQQHLKDAVQSHTAAVFVDECQFLTKKQVQIFADFVDNHKIPVYCYGIRSDFDGNLFEGSAALLAEADEIDEIVIYCSCGEKAIRNSRLSSSTEQILIGGNELYKGTCRSCAKQYKHGDKQ